MTVKDSGFGNVLGGLEFNNTATAILGNEAVTFGLENAGPAVRAFARAQRALAPNDAGDQARLVTDVC